jgi:hypothetical protein
VRWAQIPIRVILNQDAAAIGAACEAFAISGS